MIMAMMAGGCRLQVQNLKIQRLIKFKTKSKIGRLRTMRRTNGEMFNRHQNQSKCLATIPAQRAQK
jgi:hypothetical protein